MTRTMPIIGFSDRNTKKISPETKKNLQRQPSIQKKVLLLPQTTEKTHEQSEPKGSEPAQLFAPNEIITKK